MHLTRRRPTHPNDLHSPGPAALGASHPPTLPDPGRPDTRPDGGTPPGRGALATAGVAGLVYVVAGWVTFPDGPTMGAATADEIRAHVAASGGAIQGALGAGLVALAAALVFVPALARQVRDRLPGSLLADVVLGAGMLVLAFQTLVMTAESLLRLLPGLLSGVDLAASNEAAVQSWYSLGGFTHLLGDLALVPMMLLIGAFSVAARRGRLLPGWLAWAGLVIAASGVVGMAGIVGEVEAFYPGWIAAAFGYFLWVLAVSIVSLNRLRRSVTKPVTA